MFEIFTVIATAAARLSAAWLAFRLYRTHREKRFALVAAVLLIASAFPMIDVSAGLGLVGYLTPLGRALAVLLSALVLLRTLDELLKKTGELQVAHDVLEQKVAVRTAALEATNVSLAAEVSERKRAEIALRQSEDHLRRQNLEVRRLAGQLITSQEEERKRLARELHDHFGQSLAALALEVANVRRLAPDGDPLFSDCLRQAESKILLFADEVHDLSRLLHPAIIDDLGLVAAIREECRAFSEREGITVEFESEELPADLSVDTKLTLYRVTQESLRNIAKHARASSAEVVLAASNRAVHLTVHDSGKGFDVRAEQRRAGLGLVSMAERVHLLNGDVDIRSDPQTGTSIEVLIPVEEEAALCAHE